MLNGCQDLCLQAPSIQKRESSLICQKLPLDVRGTRLKLLGETTSNLWLKAIDSDVSLLRRWPILRPPRTRTLESAARQSAFRPNFSSYSRRRRSLGRNSDSSEIGSGVWSRGIPDWNIKGLARWRMGGMETLAPAVEGAHPQCWSGRRQEAAHMEATTDRELLLTEDQA